MSFQIDWRYLGLVQTVLTGHPDHNHNGLDLGGELADLIEPTISTYAADVDAQPGQTAPILQKIREVIQAAGSGVHFPWPDDDALDGVGVRVRRIQGLSPGEMLLTTTDLVLNWPFFEEDSALKTRVESAFSGTPPGVLTLDKLPGEYMVLGRALEAADYLATCPGAAGQLDPGQNVRNNLESRANVGGSTTPGNFGAISMPVPKEFSFVNSDGSRLILVIGRGGGTILRAKAAGKSRTADYPSGPITGAAYDCGKPARP